MAYTFHMKTIYADQVFLLNTVINYFILLATAKIRALPLRRVRFGAAAALGGLYSLLSLLPSWGYLTTMGMKLCLGMAMALIAFGRDKRLLSSFIAFLLVSAAFGGAVFAVSLLAGSQPEYGYYIGVSMKVLVLSFALCYALLGLVFNRLSSRLARQIMEAKLSMDGNTACFRALRDTGNELYDPISGLPVMVISPSLSSKLLTPELFGAVQSGTWDYFSDTSAFGPKSGLRLIPYSTAGLSHGLMPVFRPDELILDGKPQNQVLVGLSPTEICPDGEFSAIF